MGVHVAGTQHGHTYYLGPLEGTRAPALIALRSRAPAAHVQFWPLQHTIWQIEGGLAYNDMTPESRTLIDQLIPEYRNQLRENFVRSMQKACGRGILGKVSPGLCTDINILMAQYQQTQATLKRYENNYQALAQQIVHVMPGQYANPGPAYWSRLNPRVYARVTGGHIWQEASTLEVRVLPSSGASNPIAKRVSRATLRDVSYSLTESAAAGQAANNDTADVPIGAAITYPDAGVGVQVLSADLEPGGGSGGPPYTVTFAETGLPPGKNWTVILGGQTESAPTAAITFSGEPGGNYTYSAFMNGGDYLASPSSGSLTLASNRTIPIVFGPVINGSLGTTTLFGWHRANDPNGFPFTAYQPISTDSSPCFPSPSQFVPLPNSQECIGWYLHQEQPADLVNGMTAMAGEAIWMNGQGTDENDLVAVYNPPSAPGGGPVNLDVQVNMAIVYLDFSAGEQVNYGLSELGAWATDTYGESVLWPQSSDWGISIGLPGDGQLVEALQAMVGVATQAVTNLISQVGPANQARVGCGTQDSPGWTLGQIGTSPAFTMLANQVPVHIYCQPFKWEQQISPPVRYEVHVSPRIRVLNTNLTPIGLTAAVAVAFAQVAITPTDASTATGKNSGSPKAAVSVSGAGPVGAASSETKPVVHISDGTIISDINAKLWQDSVLKTFDIRVASQNGAVTLTGTVNTELEKAAVERIAKAEPGVQQVIDQLVVSPAPQ